MKFTEIDYETALKLDLMLLEMEESLEDESTTVGD